MKNYSDLDVSIRIVTKRSLMRDREGLNLSALLLAEILTQSEDAMQEVLTNVVDLNLLTPLSEQQQETGRKLCEFKRGKLFKIQECREGSLVIIGSISIGGLLLWMLKATIGKSFAESYEESGMHSRIKEVLSSEIPSLSRMFGNRVQTKLESLEEVKIVKIRDKRDNHHSDAIIDIEVVVQENDALEDLMNR